MAAFAPRRKNSTWFARIVSDEATQSDMRNHLFPGENPRRNAFSHSTRYSKLAYSIRESTVHTWPQNDDRLFCDPMHFCMRSFCREIQCSLTHDVCCFFPPSRRTCRLSAHTRVTRIRYHRVSAVVQYVKVRTWEAVLARSNVHMNLNSPPFESIH